MARDVPPQSPAKPKLYWPSAKLGTYKKSLPTPTEASLKTLKIEPMENRAQARHPKKH